MTLGPIVCGGGAHNPTLMRMLGEALPGWAVGTTDALGNQVLSLTAQLEAYTSDTSAGPGSSPGPTEAGG